MGIESHVNTIVERLLTDNPEVRSSMIERTLSKAPIETCPLTGEFQIPVQRVSIYIYISNPIPLVSTKEGSTVYWT